MEQGLKVLLKKCLTRFNRRADFIVGIPPLAGWLSLLGLGQGFILKDKPCPYIKTSPENDFFNKSLNSCLNQRFCSHYQENTQKGFFVDNHF